MLGNLSQQSGMPQMSAAFGGWMNNITLVKITQAVVNGLTQDTQTPVTFFGTIQPLKLRDIKQYPEGQWSWTWLQIHIQGTTAPLNTNDKIVYLGQKYKVMGRLNYTLNNYTELHVVQDFQ